MGNYSKNFDVSEIECRCGCSQYRIEYRAMMILEKVRENFGVPFAPNCGCRCEAHNATIPGSSPTSGHIIGSAFDIPIKKGMSCDDLYNFLDNEMKGWGGVILHETFCHFDTKDRYYRKRLK